MMGWTNYNTLTAKQKAELHCDCNTFKNSDLVKYVGISDHKLLMQRIVADIGNKEIYREWNVFYGDHNYIQEERFDEWWDLNWR